MAFAGLNWNKVDAPRRTAEGERHLVLPPHSEGEVPLPVPGTSAVAAIGIVPSPGAVYKFDDKYRLTASDVMRLQAALFLADYAVNGYIGNDVLYNVGEADNATHRVEYEILDALGDELLLKGPDPRAVPISTFIRNEQGHLEPVVSTVEVPRGASVEFRWPSCYTDGRNVPLVREFSEWAGSGETTTFRVRCTAQVGAARVPWRGGLEADTFRCFLRFEGTHASNWIYAEEPESGYFARQSADGVTSDTFMLVGSSGHPGRALYPGMVPDAVVVLIERVNGTVDRVPDAAVTAALSTLDGEAQLDLGALKGEDFAGAAIAWWGEANAADFAEGRALPFNVTGWDPDNPNWGISDGVNTWGAPNPPVGDIAGDWLSRVWHQANWIVVQQVAGSAEPRNWRLQKMGGPSIQSLCGGWRDDVPGGLFPRREPFHGPGFGARHTWSHDGNQLHALVFGAFYRRPYDYTSQGGTEHVWDAASVPTVGSIAFAVAGWDAAKATGDRYPYRQTGRVNVYTYAHGGAWMRATNEAQLSSEYYAGGPP